MSSEDDMESFYGGDSHEDDDRSSEESEEEDEDPKATEKLARVPGLTFCPEHKPGQMIEVCLTCRTALALVRPNVAKQLMIPDKTSSAVHRYAMRSDERNQVYSCLVTWLTWQKMFSPVGCLSQRLIGRTWSRSS